MPRTRNRNFLRGFKAFMGCIDCGEFDPEMLDFDHVRGKNFKISKRDCSSLIVLLQEIGFCEIRCKQCHQKRHQPENSLRLAGEKHPLHKLREDEVREIRRRHRIDGCSIYALGREFGVSGQMIWRIVIRKAWRWLD